MQSKGKKDKEIHIDHIDHIVYSLTVGMRASSQKRTYHVPPNLWKPVKMELL